MQRRGLTPSQWRALPRSDRLEVLAYEHVLEMRRLKVLEQVRGLPDGAAIVAQVLVLLQE